MCITRFLNCEKDPLTLFREFPFQLFSSNRVKCYSELFFRKDLFTGRIIFPSAITVSRSKCYIAIYKIL